LADSHQQLIDGISDSGVSENPLGYSLVTCAFPIVPNPARLLYIAVLGLAGWSFVAGFTRMLVSYAGDFVVVTASCATEKQATDRVGQTVWTRLGCRQASSTLMSVMRDVCRDR
jgi:hypothetical protein